MSATWMLASDGVGLAYWSSTHSFSRLWKNITKWSRAIKIYLLSDWEAYLVSLSRDGFVLQLHSWFLKKKSRCPFCIYLVNFRSFFDMRVGGGGLSGICVYLGPQKSTRVLLRFVLLWGIWQGGMYFFHSPLHKIWSLVCGLDCTWTIYAFQHRIRQSISRVCCWCTLVKLQQYLKAMVAFRLLWFRHVT